MVSYIKFEVSDEVMAKTQEALKIASTSGTVKKGANEVTKSIERNLAKFVVIAKDVQPEEVVMHLPKLCDEKKISYSYIATKEDLGKSIGLNVPCTAVSVEKEGEAADKIKEIISLITGKSKQ
ncbi:MAG: 50S ribosomal protein L7Ae [Candidatus Marsarchaeota archaeon]|jgi:large subunit ribosomal protein L7Ae|nr:50S ribosomal protein L7Ae [Candidatus Marsarchaeota archaeon]